MFSKSWQKTLLLVLLAISSSVLSSAVLNPVALVHAQGGFEYTLSNSGGVRLTPGNSGSTTIIATLLTNSTVVSNVTLSCDLTSVPTNASGTTCAFTPTSVIPTGTGSTTALTVTVPANASYTAFNLTVTAKSGSPAPIAPTTFAVIVGAKVAVNPTATANLSDTVNKSMTVDVNVTGAFIVAIFYNKAVLLFQGIDYSNNVFGNDFFLSDECVDKADVPGSGVPCIPDLTFDGPGVASIFLTTDSGNNYARNGRLFSMTFSVLSVGFSALHFVFQSVLTYPDGIPLKTVGYDGYFTNEDCGGGNLCKPPLVSFIPPLRPVALRPLLFNGTAFSQNPNGVITEYNWTSGGGLDIYRSNSPSRVGGIPHPNATIIFLLIGQHIVTFSAQDNFGARAYFTLSIAVFRVWVDLGISALSIDNTIGVFPGTVVHIVATAINNGVNPANSTLRLSINNQSVANQSIMNLGAVLKSSLSYSWNTAGLTPRVYRVDLTLDEVRDPNTNQILENDTAIIKGQRIDPNNLRVAFVQIIEPLPPGVGVFLGLNLPETVGVGIILIAVIVFAAGLVRKSRARELEPL